MSNLVAFTPKYPQFPSDLLVKLRHRSGLSQSQLAQLLGLKSERMVLYWEGGYSLPPAARLRNLIELFLAKGVFLAGQEAAEIEELWAVVKDFYDNTRGKNLPYPVFDRSWVTALVSASSSDNKEKIASKSGETLAASLGRESHEEATTFPPSSQANSELPGWGNNFPQPNLPPNNLSRFHTTATLLGRERELHELEELLIDPGSSLIVLTGPGGVGKTRLALEVATKVLTSFKDGVYFVNLSEIGDAEQLPAAIGQAFNLKVQANTLQEEVETITRHLSGKNLLLILDNFEQLVQSASILNRLFSSVGNGGFKVLITSRIDLNNYGRQRYELEPLPIPVKSADNNFLTVLPAFNPEQFQLLLKNPAIRLFVERARLVKPDFLLTPQNAFAVARICQLVDGLPLALELAAARVQLFTPQALCNRLEEGLVFTPGTYRSSPGQSGTSSGKAVLKWLNNNQTASYNRSHASLRQALEWSYNLLEKDQQDLFTKLAVFRGGFTLGTVTAICYFNSSSTSHSENTGEQKLEEAEVLNILTGLINSSLLKSTYDQDGEPRFEMLKTINEFATELFDRGINYALAQNLKQRHALYYLRLAEEALPHYRSSDQAYWYERIGNEADNMTAALEYLSKTALLKPAARLVYALNFFWFRRSLISQGIYWANLTIAAIEKFEIDADKREQETAKFTDIQDQKKWQGRLLWQLGTYIGTGSNLDKAQQMIQKGLELSNAANDTEQIIQDYHSLGYICMNQGRVEEAVGYLEQGAALAGSDKDSYSFFLAGILTNLGIINRQRQHYEVAQAILHEGLVLSREYGYKSQELMFLGTLGQLSLDRNEPEKAESYFTQTLQLAQEIEAKYLAAIAHLNIAGLAIFNKLDLSQAKFHLRQALLINLERGFKLGQLTALTLLGVILARQGEIKLASQLANTIEVELQGLGQKLLGQELQWYQAFQAAIKSHLEQECQGKENRELTVYYTKVNCFPFSQALKVALEFLN